MYQIILKKNLPKPNVRKRLFQGLLFKIQVPIGSKTNLKVLEQLKDYDGDSKVLHKLLNPTRHFKFME